ncbi:alpha/beta fold hydrolase [Roseivirga echinicomitans]
MLSETHRNITINHSTLNYTIWPGGKKIMLCFHGFGLDHTSFKIVWENLKETHTIYSFDLPYHGSSKFPRNEKSLRANDWLAFMNQFLTEEKIDCFEAMGYSMGGKYAMISAQLFPDRISHLHLIAPDGITTHFSYQFSTYPFLFRKLFKTQIKHPWFFKALVKTLSSLNIMNNYSLKFAESQMDTEFKRAQVYHSWVNLRHFLPQLNKLASQINERKTPVTFYLGKHDRVINAKEIQPLRTKIPHSRLTLMESGHARLLEAVAKSCHK